MDTAETLADLVTVLVQRQAIAEREVTRLTDELGYEQQRLRDLRSEIANKHVPSLTVARDRAKALEDRIVSLENTLHLRAQADARQQSNLDRLDQITNDLYVYITQLKGFRDKAKTKSERIALGHVVESLKLIRGGDDK